MTYKLIKISKNEKPEIKEFLLENYYPEDQILLATGNTKPSEYEINYNLDIVDNELSFKAISENEELCGIVLNCEIDKSCEQEFEQKMNSSRCEQFKKLLEFYLCWERDTHLWEVVPFDKAFSISLIAVKSSCRRKGAMKALVSKSLECAKQCKHDLVTVDCSSFYTSKYFQKMGWNCIFALPFVHFKDSKGDPIFAKKNFPHLHVTTFTVLIKKRADGLIYLNKIFR